MDGGPDESELLFRVLRCYSSSATSESPLGKASIAPVYVNSLTICFLAFHLHQHFAQNSLLLSLPSLPYLASHHVSLFLALPHLVTNNSLVRHSHSGTNSR